MRFTKIAVLMLVIFMVGGNLFAQGRNPQIELYGGVAFPLSPDAFKDVFKMGLSLNAQYVLFPSPSIGIPVFVGYERFTVDADAIGDEFKAAIQAGLAGSGLDLVSADLDVEGSASTVKFGIGIRPYLTKPEASTQIFLFGTGTYNILNEKEKFNSATLTIRDQFGNQQTGRVTAEDLQNEGAETEFKADDNKFGLAGGIGFEIPAGESLNLIIQGLFNVIMTENESTSFVGVTAGLVF